MPGFSPGLPLRLEPPDAFRVFRPAEHLETAGNFHDFESIVVFEIGNVQLVNCSLYRTLADALANRPGEMRKLERLAGGEKHRLHHFFQRERKNRRGGFVAARILFRFPRVDGEAVSGRPDFAIVVIEGAI